MIWAVPLLYTVITFVPIALLYDFGVYFLTYLSGSSKTSSIVFESMFDYIAIAIFFLRLFVQNVRLLFMLFVISGVHEILVEVRIPVKISFNDELAMMLENDFYHIFKYSYYYIFRFSGVVINVFYELLHMFFMVVFQFSAFIAMTF
jgi:hypothetical protein